MVKRLMKSIREFKGASIKAPIFVSLEVVMEVVTPSITVRQWTQKMRRACVPIWANAISCGLRPARAPMPLRWP